MAYIVRYGACKAIPKVRTTAPMEQHAPTQEQREPREPRHRHAFTQGTASSRTATSGTASKPTPPPRHQTAHRINGTAPNTRNQSINIFLSIQQMELVIYNQSNFLAFSATKKLPLKSRKNFPTKKWAKI